MIVLIVGDFGVGKDTVADLLIKQSLLHHDCDKFEKVLSYTTRLPRYEGEATHIFCTESEFWLFDDILALTKIDGNYYGARYSQFDPNKINLYVVDDQGVKKVLESNIKDDIVIVEVVRPKWLVNVPEERLERKRHFEKYDYKYDYRIMNDGDMRKLQASVIDCFDYLTRIFKKPL